MPRGIGAFYSENHMPKYLVVVRQPMKETTRWDEITTIEVEGSCAWVAARNAKLGNGKVKGTENANEMPPDVECIGEPVAVNATEITEGEPHAAVPRPPQAGVDDPADR